jgi:hypothetical protein
MERTIKQDNKRKIIQDEYINDNLLLECTYDNKTNIVTVSVRYVSELNTITETILARMNFDEYLKSFYDIIRFNDEKDTIAIFKKEDSDFRLERVFNIEEKSFIAEDFKDVVFENKFVPLKLGENLVLVNKPKRGALYWQA